MPETLTRVVAEPVQSEPDSRTKALLNLIESLERIGPFYSGQIRPPSARRGLENIFVAKLGLNPFVAKQKAKQWLEKPVDVQAINTQEDRPMLFVFGRGGIP